MRGAKDDHTGDTHTDDADGSAPDDEALALLREIRDGLQAMHAGRAGDDSTGEGA